MPSEPVELEIQKNIWEGIPDLCLCFPEKETNAQWLERWEQGGDRVGGALTSQNGLGSNAGVGCRSLLQEPVKPLAAELREVGGYTGKGSVGLGDG